MARHDKTLDRVVRGTCDAGIGFAELCGLLEGFGFEERIRGSHHIFTHPDVVEILNLQPRNRQAKPYQVRQVRQVILKYQLGGDSDAE
jgi:predicted RNA binding protein YcfA (HicA-like mRNA interferase family)